MGQQKNAVSENVSTSDITHAVNRFLAAPPEGIPVEILQTLQFASFSASLNPQNLSNPLPPKLFLETVQQAPIAISITDKDARILYINRAFEELTGFTQMQLLGKNQSILSCKSTPISVYTDMWNTITAKKVWRGTLVNNRQDRSEYLAELIVSPVFNGEGDIDYYLGMHKDISDIHQLEQQLKFQKHFTESAIDAAPMVLAMLDAQQEILLDNQAYKALKADYNGVEPAQLLLAALDQQVDLDMCKTCKSSVGFTNLEVRLDSPDGKPPRWFICSGKRIAEPNDDACNYFRQSSMGRCCLLLIANEITGSRQRTFEARLNMIRSSMVEQQMMETMRESISAAIFKLQVPLNVIKAALAMPDLKVSHSGLHGVLSQALDSGEEAMASLNSAIPAPHSEQTSLVNLNEILHEVMHLLTPRLLSAGVVVDWRPTAVLPGITGRSNALRGLIKYLIDNAINALDEARRDHREIRVQTKTSGGELIVEIMDNGVGIDADLRIKIFQPFFCGWKHPGDHSGMGLTMAQEVAVNHGGSIEVDANFAGGCRMIVRLPIESATEEIVRVHN